jgi:hypothetical protein
MEASSGRQLAKLGSLMSGVIWLVGSHDTLSRQSVLTQPIRNHQQSDYFGSVQESPFAIILAKAKLQPRDVVQTEKPRLRGERTGCLRVSASRTTGLG